MTTFADFQKLDMRLGKIVAVELLPNAKYTTHKLTIDFGPELGRKISCARVVRYTEKQLVGKLVVGVVNLPPRQIGVAVSEVLTLGLPDGKKECILLTPDTDADLQLGGKVY
ncbi:MAG: tRNA-binding protein [Candidatus Kerfeldbacteria bacterium RIFCSPHIGHO2_12_FULL_48_17]|uniref:tRNA-binding protein n=1 Tax=Candidatus Kerfeldbacteria bacterium RIFCSPHIGHO2_12_FULL_48_17 TaxID=1798542 RepID=A0A1G2AZX3_9BACT|nr:MAG: tRNA-binding protein [Candidatus Kerfeldbacteria bacterium RIFCSPHIGHO2_12_FULL_48_17]